jgi:streptogramin lyase
VLLLVLLLLLLLLLLVLLLVLLLLVVLLLVRNGARRAAGRAFKPGAAGATRLRTPAGEEPAGVLATLAKVAWYGAVRGAAAAAVEEHAAAPLARGVPRGAARGVRAAASAARGGAGAGERHERARHAARRARRACAHRSARRMEDVAQQRRPRGHSLRHDRGGKVHVRLLRRCRHHHSHLRCRYSQAERVGC